MSDAGEKKHRLGRRKIEIKKIEKKSSLQVAFSKRRTGLFKKASEFALLCGSQMAILVQSPAGKIYTFGHPSVDAVIHPLLTPSADARPPPPPPPPPPSRIFVGGSGYEEAVRELEREKRRLKWKEGESWWSDEAYEGLELHELEEYLEALNVLSDNVSKRAGEKDLEEWMNVLLQDNDHQEEFASVPLINSAPAVNDFNFS